MSHIYAVEIQTVGRDWMDSLVQFSTYAEACEAWLDMYESHYEESEILEILEAWESFSKNGAHRITAHAKGGRRV